MVTINITTLKGKTFKIFAYESSTVENIKEEIFHKEGIPIEKQKFIYNGDELEDNQYLMYYEIKDGDTIQLLENL